ncbi:MAG: O-phosphoserine--tRNA ligase [Methanosarcinales archaeon]|nr:MAG: O-phosphoserine--tRNA ligase [Methanosarcinales archaeon]
MKFNPEDFKKTKHADFDVLWGKGREILTNLNTNRKYPRRSISFGKLHPIFDTIYRLRESYLRLGFDEVLNPLIVDEKDVHKQFGYESLAVLDRCFYLAGLPRPDIGISDERVLKIKQLLNIDDKRVEEIRQILHSYKKGEVEGDDLVSVISHRLGVSDSSVGTMIELVFPEFKELKPEPTRRTLRSHMTSAWFITLKELWEYTNLPVHLFSVDRCFRREQQEDATRLMTYHSASCVMMDEDVSVDDGMAVAEGILSQFGFEDFKFIPDEKRSKYYIPDTQIEVFAYHPKLIGSNTKYSDGWVEIATFGIYSPTALAEYSIPYPVMNLGLGVERLAMILHNATDVRTLSYPQFLQYQPEWHISDHELAKMIRIRSEPKTRAGILIQHAITSTCKMHKNEPSPCEFTAWKGELFNRNITVNVIEPEEKTKLCGPAAMNTIVVNDGNILGVSPAQLRCAEPHTPVNDGNIPIVSSGKNMEATKRWVHTNLSYIDAFAAKAASEIENELCSGKDETAYRVRIIKTPAEINLEIQLAAQRYITNHNKKIDIRGPVFTTVQMKIDY